MPATRTTTAKTARTAAIGHHVPRANLNREPLASSVMSAVGVTRLGAVHSQLGRGTKPHVRSASRTSLYMIQTCQGGHIEENGLDARGRFLNSRPCDRWWHPASSADWGQERPLEQHLSPR